MFKERSANDFTGRKKKLDSAEDCPKYLGQARYFMAPSIEIISSTEGESNYGGLILPVQ